MVQVFVIFSVLFLLKSNAEDILFPSEEETFSVDDKPKDLIFNATAQTEEQNVPIIEDVEELVKLDVKAIGTEPPCRDPTGASGFCVPLGSCTTLLSIALTLPSTSFEYQMLRQSYCGTRNGEQSFCCRSPNNQLVPVTKRTTTTRPVAAITAAITKSKKQTSTFSNKKKCETADEVNSRFCGTPSKITDRIVGGKEAAQGAWPWATLLFDRSSPETFFCGGSLITNRHVLTAAHCLTFKSAETLGVRLAEHDFSTKRDGKHTNINVNSISMHPQYNLNNQNNDIAVLHLERGVCFSERITPVCVPDGSWTSKITPGLSSIAVGWGTNDPNDKEATNRSPVLQEVTLEIFSSETCKIAYKKIINAPTLHEKLICSGDRQGGKDACKGDSGGPLMLYDEEGRFIVIGVVSAGVSCGKKEFPGLFTKVSEYYPWISEVTSL